MERLFGKAAEVHGQLLRIGKMRRRLDAQEAWWWVEAVRIKLHIDVGMGSMIEYGERVLGHSAHTARERVRTAERLVDLPVTFAALREGDVGWSIARELTRVVTPETEGVWLEYIEGMTAREVEELCSGREEGDLPTSPKLEENRRYTRTIELTGAQLAAFEAAKKKVVQELGAAATEGEVLALLSAAYVVEAAPGEGSRTVRSELLMERCPDCKRGWDTSAGLRIELDDAEMSRRECDPIEVAAPKAACSHGPGETCCKENVPRGTRRTVQIPNKLRRAVLARDGHRCSVPGCRSRKLLELHHTDPLSEGGDHTMETLTTLCWAHHNAHHRGLLLIKGRAGIDLTFEQVDNTPAWVKRKFGLLEEAA